MPDRRRSWARCYWECPDCGHEWTTMDRAGPGTTPAWQKHYPCPDCGTEHRYFRGADKITDDGRVIRRTGDRIPDDDT